MQLTGQNLHNEHEYCDMRGDRDFKASDSSDSSVYFLFCAQGFNCKQVNNLNKSSLLPRHVMTPCPSLESNSPLLSNRPRNLSGKIPNGHKHAIFQSNTSNQESSLFPQQLVVFSCQSLQSNSPLLSNRSRKSLIALV